MAGFTRSGWSPFRISHKKIGDISPIIGRIQRFSVSEKSVYLKNVFI